MQCDAMPLCNGSISIVGTSLLQPDLERDGRVSRGPISPSSASPKTVAIRADLTLFKGIDIGHENVKAKCLNGLGGYVVEPHFIALAK